ncbi:MAG: sulfur carrier protein ThiS adenylyltransferase ThiF [Thermodesulfobacteriota bacterium]
MDNDTFRREVFCRNPPGSVELLGDKCVAICGAGGLGSNIALSLVRSGIQHLVIVDYDTVELSNLNRQFYFLDQVGMVKVDALRENLLRINPHLDLTTHRARVDENNFPGFFSGADILVEAFDDADQKAMVANSWLHLFPERYIVMGSGLSGYGKNEMIETIRHGRLIICGDQRTQANKENGLCAARLGVVAQMQANAVIEILLEA